MDENIKESTKDKTEGKLDQASGAIKEKAGRATNDPDLEEKGSDEKFEGKVEEKVGDVKKVFEK